MIAPELKELVRAARNAREFAHAPYSRFSVGAALRTKSGRIFVGCNVENASYGATMCAERSAVFQMVSTGERLIRAVAVYVEVDALAMPCGMCRQVLGEFAEDATIVVANPNQEKVFTLAALLPHRFSFNPSPSSTE